jgi:signal peptidase II
LKKYIRDYGTLFLLAGIIVAVDQWTKYLVRSHLQFGEVWAPQTWMMDYVRIVYWRNTGAAFGMLQHFGDVFTVLAIIVSIAILYYFPQISRQDWHLRLALSLQLGGAIGNLIDRLTQGFVTDFISIGNFAVFNVADASISIGVAVLVLGMWLKERQENSSQTEDSDQSPPTQEKPVQPLSEEMKGE